MALKYLLDENVDKVYQRQFLRRNPSLIMWVVGDPGAPPRGTLDPEILCWCEEHNFILVTNNHTSMPVHLAEHIVKGGHIPRILILSDKLSIGETIDELALIADGSFDDEYQDQIIHLPLTQ